MIQGRCPAPAWKFPNAKTPRHYASNFPMCQLFNIRTHMMRQWTLCSKQFSSSTEQLQDNQRYNWSRMDAQRCFRIPLSNIISVYILHNVRWNENATFVSFLEKVCCIKSFFLFIPFVSFYSLMQLVESSRLTQTLF